MQYPVVTKMCSERALLFSFEGLLLVVYACMTSQRFDAILGCVVNDALQVEQQLSVDCKLTQSEHLVLGDTHILMLGRIPPILHLLSNIWSSVYLFASAVITLMRQECMHSAFHSTAWTFWVDNYVQCLVHARIIIKFTRLAVSPVSLHLVPLVGMSMVKIEAVWFYTLKSMNVELERSFDSKLP
jgi:hypothetical protein